MMIKKIEQTIRKYSLLKTGETVVVALSGGADSCALLLSLLDLAEHYGLKIIVAHFNHGLRGGESDGDEAFCRSLAQQFCLIFVTEKMCYTSIPQGKSPEDYFRQERYRFLEQVAAQYQAGKIALGHHINDQAETVLINLLRGSGLDGLKGFLPIRDNKYIRPLMEVSRTEINDFLHATGVQCREDSSNNNQVYLRNRVRGELIPCLKEKYNPRIEANLARMAEIIRHDDEFLNGCVNNILQSPFIQRKIGEISFSVKYFETLHASLRYRLLKALLEDMTPHEKGFSFSHIRLFADLVMKSATGKAISLPYGLHARKDYNWIIVELKNKEITNDYEYRMTVPGTVDIKERSLTLSTKRVAADEIDFYRINGICLDWDKIKGDLIIRNRRNGDWFEPLGTKGTQKIKKLFIDRKIPKPERNRIALMVDQESVIWIENMHLSERIKVSPETRNVVVLGVRPLS
jgi:tRNA(Ile)-lysidine synthase